MAFGNQFGERNHMVKDEHLWPVLSKALKLRDEGLGYVKIGRELNLSPWTARNWVHGITRAKG